MGKLFQVNKLLIYLFYDWETDSYDIGQPPR